MTIAIEPADLAALVRPRIPGVLLAFDVDGVLAPLVDHVDDSALSDGVAAALAVLALRTPVALLSGRSLESLRGLLDFPPGLLVVGSHGLEVHGRDGLALSPEESWTYRQIDDLGERAVSACGDGAWLEYKPASVVLHTRMVAGDAARVAIGELVAAALAIPGVTIKAGHDVVELMVRSADKGSALIELAALVRASSIVFLGDDRTDEDGFTRMGAADIAVRVGPGTTSARYRLADTAAVTSFLTAL